MRCANRDDDLQVVGKLDTSYLLNILEVMINYERGSIGWGMRTLQLSCRYVNLILNLTTRKNFSQSWSEKYYFLLLSKCTIIFLVLFISNADTDIRKKNYRCIAHVSKFTSFITIWTYSFFCFGNLYQAPFKIKRWLTKCFQMMKIKHTHICSHS